MAPDPGTAVTWASRHQMLRNLAVAAATVVLTATGVTAALVWPVGRAPRLSCPADRTLVTVRPYALPLGAVGDTAPTPAAQHPDALRIPMIAGCVGRSDLTPASPERTDERG